MTPRAHLEVASTAPAIERWSPGDSSWSRPMTSRRTSSRTSESVSRRIASSRRPMRPRTSSSSRDQFSVENEYSVRYSTPRSRAARRVLRIVSTPARWPAIAGRRRWRAQRRLPSMTMAMCRGMALMRSLNGADLVCEQDVTVGQLLQLRFRALHLVGRHGRALLFRAHLVVRVATEGADLDAPLFDLLVQLLDHVLASFLGERRDVEADDRAIGVRRESQVRGLDRLLDRLDEVAVVGLDHDETRLRRADLSELKQRRRRPVRLHLELLDQGRRGPAGAHGGDVVLQRVDRLLEARLRLREDVFEGHQLCTSVP